MIKKCRRERNEEGEEQEQRRITINVSTYKGKERLSARYAISQFSFLLAYTRVIKTSLNKLHFTHNPIISQ